MILSSVYIGVCIISLVYFLLYLTSIILNFAKVLDVKVLSINPPSKAESVEELKEESFEKELITEDSTPMENNEENL